jgi:diguanylate cyclase (GGDEF)-like protein
MPEGPDNRLSDIEIAEVIRHLDAAEENHRRWLRGVHGGLVCNRALGPDVLDQNAHRNCRFGQWYYHNDVGLLQRHPEYLALEVLHRAMHDSAREIVLRNNACEPVAGRDYDLFLDRQELFAETLRGLRDRLREFLFSFDALTGVMTREPFMTQLAAEMERSRRSGDPAVVALLDLDHFKQVNDKHGHLTGDRVLRDVGQFLFRNLRRYDLFCRYGGEEFLACLPQVRLDEAARIMDRLRAELAEHDIPLDGGRSLRVTVSVGLAELAVDSDMEGSIERADQALYAAKEAGRNRVMSHPQFG